MQDHISSFENSPLAAKPLRPEAPLGETSDGQPLGTAPPNPIEVKLSAWDPVTAVIDYPGHYLHRKRDDSGDLLAYCGSWPCVIGSAFGGEGRVSFPLAGPFRLGKKKHPQTQKWVPCRVYERKFAPSGEAIPPSINVEGWRLIKEFEAEASWKGDWEAAVAAVADVARQEEGFWQMDHDLGSVQAEVDRQAAASRRDPQAALARGIASGVAEALAALGLTPKAKGTKA